MQRATGSIGARGDIGVRLRGVLDELRLRQLAARVRHDSHRRHVPRLVHIVGRGEDRDKRVAALMVVTVAGGLHLVGAQGHAQAVVRHEVPAHIRAEEVDAAGHAAGGAVAVLALGVGPEQVHHQRVLIRVGLHEAVGVLNLLQADLELTTIEADLVVNALPPDARVGARDAAVDNEGLAINHVAERRGPEDLGEQLSHLLVVLGLDLTEEAVEVVRQLALVIATVQVDAIRMLQLEGDERKHHLHTPGTTVHEVAVEDELAVRRGIASEGQHVREVVELAVQITHHRHLLALRHRHTTQRLLLHKDVKEVDSHHVRILHGKDRARLGVRNHLVEERLVD
mmetsp:Transcript_2116/g.5502  ORF Transcript_2116/g.5502 Transcript_2116/m.5502 type:complete len:340 (-) Transcript_2116:873-1892(-)